MNREGFGTRKILILKWIFLGNLLTMSYKSTLLSTLVTIRYNEPIDTLAEFDKSGLLLLIRRGTANYGAFLSDTRPEIKKIYNRTILYTLNRQTSKRYSDM